MGAAGPRNDTLYEMRYESGRATARVAPTGLVVGADDSGRRVRFCTQEIPRQYIVYHKKFFL